MEEEGRGKTPGELGGKGCGETYTHPSGSAAKKVEEEIVSAHTSLQCFRFPFPCCCCSGTGGKRTPLPIRPLFTAELLYRPLRPPHLFIYGVGERPGRIRDSRSREIIFGTQVTFPGRRRPPRPRGRGAARGRGRGGIHTAEGQKLS